MTAPDEAPPVPSQPRSTVPADAVERVVARHDDGAKQRAELWLRGELVGERWFHPCGGLELEWSCHRGRRHGWFFRWDVPGQRTSAEPWVDGLPHGTAYQWRDDGSILGCYTMDRGTGFDLWWAQGCDAPDPDGCMPEHLAEVHSMRGGRPHGFEWWLTDDETVHSERHWHEGELHGIEREWNGHGRIARGYPRYWVRGVRVDKRRYLRAAAADPTLPPWREDDGRPARDFPDEVARHLRTRRR